MDTHTKTPVVVGERNEDLRTNLKNILTAMGYEVVGSCEGWNVADVSKICHPGVVILRLPDVDGELPKALEQIKEILEAMPEIQVIVYGIPSSGHHEPDSFKDNGICYFLTMPFHNDELTKAMRVAISLRQPQVEESSIQTAEQ